MATIKDVAQASGVTPMTVWSVLSNRPDRVGAQTRERVLRAVRETGYKPRPAKRATERGHMNTIGVLTGGGYYGLSAPGYMHQILDGIIAAAAPARQHLTLFETSPFYEDAAHSIRAYCDGRCDGLLIMPPFSTHEIMPALVERGFPFVVIGEAADPSVPSVDVDNVAAAEMVVSLLVGHGHRRIGFLRDNDVLSARQREEGFRRALTAHGLPTDEGLICAHAWSEAAVPGMASDLLRRPAGERPTALFCWNDTAAFRAVQVAQHQGLSVPGDVSIVGFNDDQYATVTYPPLTTVRQPYRQIGAQAVEMLLAQVNADTSWQHQVLLPGHLIVRDSVAPPSL